MRFLLMVRVNENSGMLPERSAHGRYGQVDRRRRLTFQNWRISTSTSSTTPTPNGAWEADEIPLFGWAMNVTNAKGSLDETKLTASPDGITTWLGLDPADNPYDVTEGTGAGMAPVRIDHQWRPDRYAGKSSDRIEPCSRRHHRSDLRQLLHLQERRQVQELVVGNHTAGPRSTTAPRWVPEFTLLNALSLRTAAGADFNLDLAQPQAYQQQPSCGVG